MTKQKRDRILEAYERILESNGKLKDEVYKALSNIKEFKNLSMDRQGELSIQIAKMIQRG
jgi:hypothetical protein